MAAPHVRPAAPADPVRELLAACKLSDLDARFPRRTWVATVGDEVVGTASVVEHDGAAYLEAVAVDRAHRRRGVGAALLARALADTPAALRLFTMFWNVQFYEKAGFTKAPSTAEAKRRDAYSAQPKYKRCVAMEFTRHSTAS